MRGVTVHIEVGHKKGYFISIHTPHAGSDIVQKINFVIHAISIHTPHAGSDQTVIIKGNIMTTISIHTPHAGSDKISF